MRILTRQTNKQTMQQVGFGSATDPVPHDFYRTGAVATRSLLSVELFSGVIWEPACGVGDMAEVLKRGENVTSVISTDIVDRGYGKQSPHNFLTDPPLSGFNHIVTNPPYSLAEAFALRAIDLVPRNGKVALFCRTLFLEGTGRRDRLFKVYPPTRIWVLSARPPMAKGDMPFQVGLVSFSWFVWDSWTLSGKTKRTQLGWV